MLNTPFSPWPSFTQQEANASWKDIKFNVTTAKCDRLVKVSEV